MNVFALAVLVGFYTTYVPSAKATSVCMSLTRSLDIYCT